MQRLGLKDTQLKRNCHCNFSRRSVLLSTSFARLKGETPQNAAQLEAREAIAPVLENSTSTKLSMSEIAYETDKNGWTRLMLNLSGWQYWSWRGHKIHYVEAGKKGNPVVLLIHGYGASAYHWRYNIPYLEEKGYHVFAMDMLGFGWSEKASIDYSNCKVWIAQIADFIREVAGGGPVVIVGNSLGGYASLSTAADKPELIRAVVSLNGAGPLDNLGTSEPQRQQQQEDEDAPLSLVEQLREVATVAVKRVVLFFAFYQAKSENNIRKVLELVYVTRNTLDDELVKSIQHAAEDPNAVDVFFRVNHSTRANRTLNVLLPKLRCPLLLLWGDLDPWIIPARADKMVELYPSADRVRLQSGHCPHDDTPVETNEALRAWLLKIGWGTADSLLGAELSVPVINKA